MPSYEELMASKQAPSASQAGAAAFSSSAKLPSYDELVSSKSQPAPTLQNQARADADTTGASKFYPDTNISKPELAANQFMTGITGQSPEEAASFGLKQALRDGSISYQQFLDMRDKMAKEQASPNSYSQQLETAKAENPTLSAGSELAGQATDIAMTQGPINEGLGAIFKLGAEGLSSVSKSIATSVVPQIDKMLSKIGGSAGVQKLGDVLEEYGLTSAPRTLRQFGNKVSTVVNTVGEKLGKAWGLVDQAASSGVTGEQATNSILENWKTTYKQASKVDPSSELEDYMSSELKKRLKPDQSYSYSYLKNLATDIQSGAWDKSALNQAKADVQLGFAIRRSSLELAAENGIPKDLLSDVAKQSSDYNKIASADFALQAKLRKKDILGNTAEFVRHAMALKAGPVGSVADLAYSAGKSALGKTTAAAAAKVGSNILSVASDMGPYTKTIFRIAADQGLQALHDWHLKQLLDNPKYEELYNQAKSSEVK